MKLNKIKMKELKNQKMKNHNNHQDHQLLQKKLQLEKEQNKKLKYLGDLLEKDAEFLNLLIFYNKLYFFV